jgi:Zn-dependent protease with chaperone function
MARTYEAAGQMQIANAVALLAALLLGQVDGELGEAALATALGGSAQAQLNFIRSNEEEADRIGIQILARPPATEPAPLRRRAARVPAHPPGQRFAHRQRHRSCQPDAAPETA